MEIPLKMDLKIKPPPLKFGCGKSVKQIMGPVWGREGSKSLKDVPVFATGGGNDMQLVDLKMHYLRIGVSYEGQTCFATHYGPFRPF